MKRSSKSNLSDGQSAASPPESSFAWSLTRTAVSQTCESVGYKRAQTSALQVLTDVATLYLKSVAKTAAASANRHGRTESNLIDIVFALEELAAVQGFSGASSVLGARGSGVVRDLMKFVKYSDEIPFAQALPLGGMFCKGAVRFSKCGERREDCVVKYSDRLSYVPNWLPVLPVVENVVEERKREVKWECLGEKGVENVSEETRKGGEIGSVLPEKRERVRFRIGEKIDHQVLRQDILK